MRAALNAHFLHHPATGSGQYLLHLTRALARGAAVEPLLLCDGHPAAPAEGFPAPPRFHATPLDRLGGDAAKVWWEQVGWPRLAASSGAEVAHVPYFAPPLVHAGRQPVIVTIHDLIPLILPEYVTSPLVRFYNALVSRAARRADLILADSEASQRDIVRLLGIPEQRVRVVYLAADASYSVAAPEAQLQAMRARYGLQLPCILYIGGLDKRKNVPALLRALATLPPDREWQLAVVGRLQTHNPRLFPDLPALARSLGLEERVRFLGYLPEEDKRLLYRAATCFAFPSVYEGFGLDPLEALASGTPVVCSNRSSLPELMGDAALLVDPDDPSALADALRRLLTDADLRADLARRGPIQASRFSWDTTARQTADAYQQALQQSRGRPA